MFATVSTYIGTIWHGTAHLVRTDGKNASCHSPKTDPTRTPQQHQHVTEVEVAPKVKTIFRAQ
jgi:hypothetical protein